MQALTALLVLGLALSAYGFPQIQPRIVGGRDAPIGKYPYVVSLRSKGRHFCGGSIINKRYILTAAHCLVSLSPNAMSVHVGTSFAKNESGEIYFPDKLIPHHKYDGFDVNDDIGLIHLKKDIKFNAKVQPIELAQEDSYGDGHPALLIGWGRLRYMGESPNNLQEIDLKVVSYEKCKAAHWRIKTSNICTFTRYGEGACHGDSGGPLSADNVQIGIVSFGKPCAVGVPDAYTKVSYYKDWLAETMAIYGME